MYFYLIYSGLDDYEKSRKKIGITCRSPNQRLAEHRTTDISSKFLKVIKLINDHETKQFLRLLEKKCKSATIKYAELLEINQNTECRYNIDKYKLWDICKNIINDFQYIELEINEKGEVINQINETGHDEKNELTLEELYTVHDEIKKTNFPMQLRGYQFDAYHQICNYYIQGRSHCNLNILCRCGKTVLFSKFAYEYLDNFESIIYVTHRLSLIDNMYQRIKSIFKTKIKYIEISSSDSEISVSDEELNMYIEKNTKLFVFACNESFHRLNTFLQSYSKCLIIFDEVHYLCTELHEKHPFIIISKLTHNPCNFIITCTATPKYGLIKSSNRLYCNDSRYFGNYEPISYTNIADAEQKQFLAPIKIICKKFDSCNNQIANAICLLKHMKKELPIEQQPKKILAYTNSIQCINDTYENIKKEKELSNFMVYKVSSATPKNNKKHLEEFIENKNQSILINCQMLAAGINIDELDCILFIDEKSQKDEIIQIIFRPRNYIPNKVAYLLIPLIKPVSGCDVYKDSTIMIVLQELYRYGDPSVMGSILTRNYDVNNDFKWGMKSLNLDNHFIDDDIKIDILEINKTNLAKQKPLSLMIVESLMDGKMKTATEIWNCIKKTGYIPPSGGKTPMATCNAKAHKLAIIGCIGIDKTSKPDKFFKIRCIPTNVKIENEND